MKMKSKRKILIIVLSVVIVLFIAGDWALSVIIYNENFNQRFESDEAFIRHVNFSFSVIFIFLAFFQVLQCAFLIFHVFQ